MLLYCKCNVRHASALSLSTIKVMQSATFPPLSPPPPLLTILLLAPCGWLDTVYPGPRLLACDPVVGWMRESGGVTCAVRLWCVVGDEEEVMGGSENNAATAVHGGPAPREKAPITAPPRDHRRHYRHYSRSRSRSRYRYRHDDHYSGQ